jgi:hypothetical protein
MPGIFGAVAVQRDRDAKPVAKAMLSLLGHRDWYRSALRSDGPWAFGAVSTNPWFAAENHLAETPQALLLVEGTAITLDGNPVADDAPDLARRMLDFYLADGDRFCARIGGHFNLVVADRRDGRVQLLNDRLGFSHLYWYADQDVFLFAPELKAFLGWRGFPRRVEPAAAATLLAHECPLGETTLLEGVRMLGPAARVIWDGRRVLVERRWRPEPQPEPGRARDDLLDEAEALYARALAKRLPASYDGRTVVALSGGLDSRLLLHQVRQRPNLDIFTHGRRDNSEYVIARQVARSMGLADRHRLVEIDPAWAGRYARLAVWLNDGQLNMRNATSLGISEFLGPGPYPYLNGILGSHLSLGGPACSEEDLRPAGDPDTVRRRTLRFSGVEAGAARFTAFLRPDLVEPMQAMAREQVLAAFAPWDYAPLFGDQKAFYFHFNMGRRMQGTNDVLKYQFHDLLPYADEELFDFSLRIPLAEKCGMALFHEYYRTRLTPLARIPWQHTGHDLFAPDALRRRTAQRRQAWARWNQALRRWTRGRVNLRSRHAYTDRPAWLRRNKVYRDEVFGVLSSVGSTGCDWFAQDKVDALAAAFLQGHDDLFHTLAKIYTMVVWHGLFLRDAPPGSDLAPRRA